MNKKEVKRYSLEFGKKEKVLNYACQTYQLSRPNKVGAVMALIRECQPQTIEEWEEWYLSNAYTAGKNAFKITKDSLQELGERLFEKITEVVIPEWQEAFSQLTKEDCINYIYNLTINRTFDGFLREKSVVNDGLAKNFPQIRFEESSAELDHAGDIDYLGYISENRAFGIQIKPVTAKANFGNYSVSERMKASFDSFKEDFGGKVFIVYSLDGEIANKEILESISNEIERLNAL
ncbi:MjaI family restriction endonuclease [Massilibacteroides sp.]|uniref:MjaI family restriction endonuclease n=1 Tax=Massilibacteroides sp. TaxID=2034766 RepID=UPI00261C3674|nr:MjaI family restriction endonuclease [Massilibacteroides sp.]MDD4516015.1 MjaI family restriction endonuclease [Massilibacteroides sp.]